MDYTSIIIQIVKEQEKIIGPIAVELANNVEGLSLISLESKQITFDREGKLVVHDLVRVYSEFFGKASIEVCREVIKRASPTIGVNDLEAMTGDIYNAE